jgi:NAD dependent epimerase/dehydratase family enzyme
MSWIAIGDLVDAIVRAIGSDTLAGAVNATAPASVTNAEFAATLARVLGRPAWLPAPAFALRAVLGRERAEQLLLASQRVEPVRLLASGFAFRTPRLEEALRAVLGRSAVS